MLYMTFYRGIQIFREQFYVRQFSVCRIINRTCKLQAICNSSKLAIHTARHAYDPADWASETKHFTEQICREEIFANINR